ncbi:MAG: sugar ABC transporter permease [Rhodobacteraceae bacterium]|nr:MAG: sugar ABC transporter permease [Paracoccaceae bacterium]
MNFNSIKAIYRFEMARAFRTIMQSILAPVVSTSLYFIVFGAAIGSKISQLDGVPYGAFIIPGLMMLSVMTTSVNYAAFGIYLPKYTGSIYEIMSAPISAFEVIIGYVGAAATKSILISFLILLTATAFVSFEIQHPLWMLILLIITGTTFSLFGFIIGLWASNWEKLQLIPLIVITPLVFLGGSFYSTSMLPVFWQTITKLNPIFYIINGFRWSFFGSSDVAIHISLFCMITFLLLCITVVSIIFKTGYKIRD